LRCACCHTPHDTSAPAATPHALHHHNPYHTSHGFRLFFFALTTQTFCADSRAGRTPFSGRPTATMAWATRTLLALSLSRSLSLSLSLSLALCVSLCAFGPAYGSRCLSAVSVCVCERVCVYCTYTNTCMHTQIHTCMYAYVHAYPAYIHTCMPCPEH
jgi:hypothetical protein